MDASLAPVPLTLGEAIGEAFATIFLFAFILLACIASVAVAGLLIVLRRSVRGGLAGLALAVPAAALSWLATGNEPLSASLGVVGFVVGVLLAGRLIDQADPVRSLRHPVVVAVSGVLSVGGLLTAGMLWAIIIGALGLGTLELLLDNPDESLFIVVLTAAAILCVAASYRGYTRPSPG